MTELLKKIVDEAPMGIYVLDAERKIVFWSTGAERITGYSQEEMVGRHCFEGMLDHIDREGGSSVSRLLSYDGYHFRWAVQGTAGIPERPYRSTHSGDGSYRTFIQRTGNAGGL